MNDKRSYGLYVLALVIVVVGALAVGASLESLLRLALVAACPLMMFFMMRSMHGPGMHGSHDQRPADRDEDPLRKQARPPQRAWPALTTQARARG